MNIPKKEGRKLGDNNKGIFSTFPKSEMKDVQKRMSRLFCTVCRKVTPHNFKGCTQHVEETKQMAISYKCDFFSLSPNNQFVTGEEEEPLTLQKWLEDVGKRGFKVHRIQPITWANTKTGNQIVEMIIIATKE